PSPRTPVATEKCGRSRGKGFQTLCSSFSTALPSGSSFWMRSTARRKLVFWTQWSQPTSTRTRYGLGHSAPRDRSSSSHRPVEQHGWKILHFRNSTVSESMLYLQQHRPSCLTSSVNFLKGSRRRECKPKFAASLR